MAIAPASVEPGLRALIGTELNGFEIHEPIGLGGMGVVFRGVQRSLQREVAIKVALPSLGPEQAARFAREGKTAALLDHPNCITVYEFGSDRGVQYMVMPLLRGRPLSDVLEKGTGSVSHERAVNMGIQILRGLEHAHSRGVVHRDLKPQNVFIVEDEYGSELLKLVDFGIAKIVEHKIELSGATMSGLLSGTPEYMSPEQALGLPTDTRSDIYSAGLILYHLLTGALPFTDDDPIVQLRRHITDEIPLLPRSVSPPLSRLVLRMVRKERDERYPTVSEALEDLVAVSNGAHLLPSEESVPEPPAFDSIPAGDADLLGHTTNPADESGVMDAPSLPDEEPVEPAPSQGRTLWAAGAAAIVVLALTVGFYFGLSDGEAQPRDSSEVSEASGSAPEAASREEGNLLAKLSAVNNPDRAQALGYQTRQQYLEELRADTETAPLVDARLNLALDLSQASQSPIPCQTFRAALDAIEATRDGYFVTAVSLAQTPTQASGPACDGLDERRKEVLAALERAFQAEAENEGSQDEADDGEPAPRAKKPRKQRPRGKPNKAKRGAPDKPSPEPEASRKGQPQPKAAKSTPAPWERREPATEVKNPFE